VRVLDRVETGATFVDGLGVGDVHEVALRDRRHLSEDGVLIVVMTVGSQNGREIAAPEVIARGFSEPGPILDEARDEAERTLSRLLAENVSELKLLQEHIHDAVGQLVKERTGRRPMILPVILEI
jgi:ribonuclease J